MNSHPLVDIYVLTKIIYKTQKSQKDWIESGVKLYIFKPHPKWYTSSSMALQQKFYRRKEDASVSNATKNEINNGMKIVFGFRLRGAGKTLRIM